MRNVKLHLAVLLLCVGVVTEQRAKADVYMYATTDLAWPNSLDNGNIRLAWHGHPSLGGPLTLDSCCPWGGYDFVYYPGSSGMGLYGEHAVMQNDGNFVVYDGSWNAVWSTGTSGNSGAFAALQDDGNFVIYNSSNTALWAKF